MMSTPKINLCRYGLRCYRKDCYFAHPEGWNPTAVPRLSSGCYAAGPGGLVPADRDGYRAAGMVLLAWLPRRDRAPAAKARAAGEAGGEASEAAAGAEGSDAAAPGDADVEALAGSLDTLSLARPGARVLHALMAVEERRGRVSTSFLGGRIEEIDGADPLTTAIREMCEEAAEVVTGEELRAVWEEDERHDMWWLGPSKYVLHLARVSPAREAWARGIPARHQEAMSQVRDKPSTRPEGWGPDRLPWGPVDSVGCRAGISVAGKPVPPSFMLRSVFADRTFTPLMQAIRDESAAGRDGESA